MFTPKWIRATKLVTALLLLQSLSACAFGTAATLIGIAPGLAQLEPARVSSPPYTTTVSGVSVAVRPWIMRGCAATPPATGRPGAVRCAMLVFAPQSGLSPETGLRIAETVIARNKHMNPTNVDRTALIAGNRKFMSINDPNINNTFSFPYYSGVAERTVFAQ